MPYMEVCLARLCVTRTKVCTLSECFGNFSESNPAFHFFECSKLGSS